VQHDILFRKGTLSAILRNLNLYLFISVYWEGNACGAPIFVLKAYPVIGFELSLKTISTTDWFWQDHGNKRQSGASANKLVNSCTHSWSL